MYLIDTSVLARLANTADRHYKTAATAVKKLHKSGVDLKVAPQSLMEFRHFATRPVSAGGLELPSREADLKAAIFQTTLEVLPETCDVFKEWNLITGIANVIGKRVHDARLVAICQLNAISHILAFNVSHFTTLAQHVPGLTIVHPTSV